VTPVAAIAASPASAFSLPFTTRAVESTATTDRPYNGYAHSFAGMGVQFILFMGIEVGVGVLLARRLGLWKRLRAAPLSRSLLLGSHIASGAITALILLAIIYAAAIGIFHVRIDGSVAGFVGIAIAFALLTSSFGLLIAAIGKTPEATRGLAIFATLVMVMLGGAWVPSFVFPPWLQTASLVVPTRWAVDGLDAMTWRGPRLRRRDRADRRPARVQRPLRGDRDLALRLGGAARLTRPRRDAGSRLPRDAARAIRTRRARRPRRPGRRPHSGSP
jgi:ABC-2 type transport system permease protein